MKIRYILAFLSAMSASVQAASITYNFSAVDFDWSWHTVNVNGKAKIRGGTLDGFVTFDTDTSTVIDFDFETWQPVRYDSNGISTIYDSADTNTNTSASLSNTSIFIDYRFFDGKYSRRDRLRFDFADFSGSDAVDVMIYERRDRCLPICNATIGAQGSNSPVVAVNAASVSAVPVPAAVWLFGTGLLGLMGIARRRDG